MFKVIEDYETARGLSEAGLLWCSIRGRPPLPDFPGYWVNPKYPHRNAAWFALVRESGTEHCLLLEE